MGALISSSDRGDDCKTASTVNEPRNKGISLLSTVTIEKPKVEIKLNEL